MLADKEWDTAFEVSVAVDAAELLIGLVEAALYDLLDRGLFSLLTRIVSTAHSAGLSRRFSLWRRLRWRFVTACTTDPRGWLRFQVLS